QVTLGHGDVVEVAVVRVLVDNGDARRPQVADDGARDERLAGAGAAGDPDEDSFRHARGTLAAARGGRQCAGGGGASVVMAIARSRGLTRCSRTEVFSHRRPRAPSASAQRGVVGSGRENWNSCRTATRAISKFLGSR